MEITLTAVLFSGGRAAVASSARSPRTTRPATSPQRRLPRNGTWTAGRTVRPVWALLLDLMMIEFTLLALGLSRAGQSARAERTLILVCAAASAYMNVSAAKLASARSVAAYAIAPVALAVVVDRVVAVIHRHVLAGAQPSAWTTVGRAAAATARIAGLIVLYCLRFALAAPETARGLRRIVLDAAPLPARPEPAAPEAAEPARTKKAVLLALYRAHPDYGNRGTASQVAAELAPQAGLQAGTARSYLYAELDGGKA